MHSDLTFWIFKATEANINATKYTDMKSTKIKVGYTVQQIINMEDTCPQPSVILFQ